jgi:hypothetical protein
MDNEDRMIFLGRLNRGADQVHQVLELTYTFIKSAVGLSAVGVGIAEDLSARRQARVVDVEPEPGEPDTVTFDAKTLGDLTRRIHDTDNVVFRPADSETNSP